MKTFLLSCLAVVVIAAGAYALLEGGLARNSGDVFAVPGATRVSDSYKPLPGGALSHVTAPAGGVTSGRDQTPGAGAGVSQPHVPVPGVARQ